MYTMAKKKIRLGLIGCGGNMRNAHVPRLLDDGQVELVGLVDTAAEPAQLLMEKWGKEVPLYTNYKEMLKADNIDGLFECGLTRAGREAVDDDFAPCQSSHRVSS
jgi:predicted dehydrogenase